VIGNIGTYSGAFGDEYADSYKGFQAWVDATNAAGGVNGHPIQVVSVNDQGDATKSLAGVKDLVENKHAVAIVDAMSPNGSAAFASYLAQQKIPVIGGLPTDTTFMTQPLFFPTAATSVGFLTGQFNGVSELNGSKLGLFLCTFAACQSGIPLFTQIAQGLKIAYAGQQTINASAPSFTAQCLTFKNQGVDSIIPELDGPTTKRVVDDCVRQGFKPHVIVPASTISADVLADPAFDGALGVTESQLWFGDDAEGQAWYKAYKAKFPNDTPGGFASLGWQAGLVLGAALKNAPAAVTPANVLKGLYAIPAGTNFDGVTPPLTYTAGKPAVVGNCVWYVQIKDKAFTAPKGSDAVCLG
jgi:branched-chain amino acid transport system substrate-binding protein